jgi:hypothetical protein
MSTEKGCYKLFPDIGTMTSDSNLTETIHEYTKTVNKMKEQLSYDLFGRLTNPNQVEIHRTQYLKTISQITSHKRYIFPRIG